MISNQSLLLNSWRRCPQGGLLFPMSCSMLARAPGNGSLSKQQYPAKIKIGREILQQTHAVAALEEVGCGYSRSDQGALWCSVFSLGWFFFSLHGLFPPDLHADCLSIAARSHSRGHKFWRKAGASTRYRFPQTQPCLADFAPEL